MDITREIRRLEKAGFACETLDRAVALAGNRRLVYLALLEAVEHHGLAPMEAVQALEQADRL